MSKCLTCGKDKCTEPFHLELCPRCSTRAKTYRAIHCRPCSKRIFSSAQDAEIEMLYRGGWLVKDIAARYRVKRHVISGVLDRAKVKRRTISRTKSIYEVNEFFFDSINNEQQAYWFGFIAADGSVSITSKKYSVNIELKAQDKDHLIKFRSQIGSTHPLLTREQTVKGKQYKSVRISIGSQYLSNSLIALGVVPGRSNTFSYPDISSNLDRHFIRGYFDGDGSLSLNNRNGYINLIFSITGNEPFLLSIQNILMAQCNLSKTKLATHNKSAVKSLVYGGNIQVPRIMDFIFQDAAVYLERKWHRYFHWLQSRK